MKRKWLGIPVWGWVATGVVVVGGVLYLRHKNSAAAAAAAATQAAGSGATVGVAPTAGYAATSAGQGYSGGGQNSAALSQILSDLQATQAPATTASTTPATTLNYAPLTSWQGAQDLIAAGQQVDYAPPGTPAGTYDPAYNAGTAAAPSLLAGPGGAPLPTGTTLYLPG